MGKVKNENYYVTYGWMVNELGLKGNELQIFALIYGFSQSNKSFNGSISYLADWIGGRRATATDVLNKLIKKNLVIKETNYNGIPNIYKINPKIFNEDGLIKTDVNENSTGTCTDLVQDVNENSTGTCTDLVHNNNINNNIDNNIIDDDNKEPLNTEKQIEKYYDDDFKEVADSFSNNIHPINGKLEADMLIDLIDEYGKQWVIEGITEMVKYHGTNVAYLNRILLNWKKYGKNNKPKKEQQQMNSAEYGF